MELKYDLVGDDGGAGDGFNRTFMELKLLPRSRCGRRSCRFNRTFMELK